MCKAAQGERNFEQNRASKRNDSAFYPSRVPDHGPG